MTATEAATPTRLPRDIPPLWLFVVIAGMWTLHLAWPVGRWLELPWTRVGWVVQALALTMMLSSLRLFRLARTGLRPFSPVARLIVEGAYRWTRNPMYLGMVGISIGVAICFGTLPPLVGPPLLFVLLDRRFVRREERFLRQVVGTAYDEYCERVPRWL